MSDSNQLVTARLQKIQRLRELGIDPYPAPAFRRTHSVSQLVDSAEHLIRTEEPVRTAGRVAAIREMGKAIFFDILDDGGRVQVYLRRSNVASGTWEAVRLVDLGDFIGVEGRVFRTRTGELTLNASQMIVLGKASKPVPLPKVTDTEAFNRIADKNTLYRHRHLDLLLNRQSREVFEKRSQVIRGIRRYLDSEGFLEVETPILGSAYSGASARPFVTHLNVMDQEMFLRISPECALKRLLCGGLNRVYELGKNFRNEGIDASHNPEFVMVEWYEAFSDYRHQMERFETLVAGLTEEINGTMQITYRGRSLNLTPPWRRLSILDGLKEVAGIDLGDAKPEDFSGIFARRHPRGVDALPIPLTWGSAVVELFEALVEPQLWDPVFVMDHPVEISPLTKKHRDDPRLVERFEPMIAGMEVGNSYSELNDPVEQYDRLVAQQVAQEKAYDLDEDFLEAISHGMPPAGGTGLGVDRIVMILTGAESIRDVIFFPFVGRAVSAPARGEEVQETQQADASDYANRSGAAYVEGSELG